MIANTDIFDLFRWAYGLVVNLADFLNMTPLTLIIIVVVVFSILHSIAERANARRDMERAIRNANQPPES